MDKLAPPASEEQTAARPPGGTRWTYWVVMFLFLYVLGLGPAEKLANWYPSVRPVITVVYFPIIMLYDVCPPTRPAINWYLRFWR
jgi:hypothetical protein